MAAGLASSIAASRNQRRANDEIRSQSGMIEKNRSENRDIFDRQYFQDVTRRSDISNMIRLLGEESDVRANRDKAQATVMGLSPEARLAQQAERSKAYANGIATLASNAATLKDSYIANWQNQNNNYWRQRLGMSDKIAGIHSNTSNQWSKTASGFYDIGSNFAEDAIGSLKTDGIKRSPASTSIGTPADTAIDGYPYLGFGDPHANETWS